MPSLFSHLLGYDMGCYLSQHMVFVLFELQVERMSGDVKGMSMFDSFWRQECEITRPQFFLDVRWLPVYRVCWHSYTQFYDFILNIYIYIYIYIYTYICTWCIQHLAKFASCVVSPILDASIRQRPTSMECLADPRTTKLLSYQDLQWKPYVSRIFQEDSSFDSWIFVFYFIISPPNKGLVDLEWETPVS